MSNSIEIHTGKFGFFLKVNGFAIKRDFTNQIHASKTQYPPTSWNASEWDSISSLRKFWNDYRLIILSKSQF